MRGTRDCALLPDGFRWVKWELNVVPVIPQELLAAYEATDYVVDTTSAGAAKHVITVGSQSTMVAAALLRALGACQAVIVTAWNPFSRPLIGEVNHARQRRLLDFVVGKSYRWLPAAGVDRSGKWPPEESLCVLDVEPEDVRELLERFEQYALVEVTRAGARLVLHPSVAGRFPR